MRVGEAMRAGTLARDELFVVSKVYPHNASARGTGQACERSLARLGLDQLDLYLLHWRGDVPLAGDRRRAVGPAAARPHSCAGASATSTSPTWKSSCACPGGERCTTNQIYYSLGSRGPGFELVPWLQQHGIMTMAYSPIDQGALARSAKLRDIAARRGATPAQIALAWLMAQEGVMAIPKAASEPHQRENFAAQDLVLTDADRADLDAAFPPPRRASPLAML